jgi:hypothetical protein
MQEGSKSHLVVGRPCIARKIGFPELILPNDVRNDLYVNIFSAELSRLNKTADRNVEVCNAILLLMVFIEPKFTRTILANICRSHFPIFLVGCTIRLLTHSLYIRNNCKDSYASVK